MMRILRLFCVILGLVLALAAPQRAGATDLIGDVAYLEDVTGTLDVQAVAGMAFVPVSASISRGYGSAAHWLRIKVAAAPDGGAVLLKAEPAYLDEITLYEPNAGAVGGWSVQVTGDQIRLHDRPWQAVSLGFMVTPEPQGTVYYLRLRTQSTAILTVSARPLAEARVAESRRIALHVALFAMMGLAALLATYHAWRKPDLVAGLLVFNQMTFMVYAYFVLGYAAVGFAGLPLLETFAARGADGLYLVAMLANMLFHRMFLARSGSSRRMLRIADAVILAECLVVALYLVGVRGLAFQINSLLVLLFVPILAGLALTARGESDPPLRILRPLYVAYCGLIALWMLVLLGLPDALSLMNVSVEVHAGLNLGLIILLVFAAMRSATLRRQALEAALREAEIQADIAERTVAVQDKLMNMLVHEVRNHLAIIGMSMSAPSVAAEGNSIPVAVQRLDTILTDCVHMGWLENGDWHPKLAPVSLFAAVIEAMEASGQDDRLRLDGGEAEPLVMADRAMLAAALGHVIGDALHRSPDGGLVLLDLFEVAGPEGAAGHLLMLRYTVSEETEFDPERIFDKYYRGEFGAPMRGAGLGMAITRGIIEAQGGRISMTLIGGRAEARIWLPAAPVAVAA